MKTVYFWWSAAEILRVTFVRWQRKLKPTPWGGKLKREKGWWGIGAVVHSSWAWNYPEAKKASRREGLPLQHVWLAPHTELYKTRRGAVTRRGQILKRPTNTEYVRLLQRRKQEKALRVGGR